MSQPPLNFDDGTGTQSSIEQRRALDDLYSHFYEELRHKASAFRRRNPSITLNSTALVNEAWVKVASSPHLNFVSVSHLKRIIGKAMEQILVDAARRRGAIMRGRGVEVVFMDIDALAGPSLSYSVDLISLEVGLEDLEKLNPRQAEIVRDKVFCEMTVKEVASLHGVSETTVEREWRAARAWLVAMSRPKGQE